MSYLKSFQRKEAIFHFLETANFGFLDYFFLEGGGEGWPMLYNLTPVSQDLMSGSMKSLIRLC